MEITEGTVRITSRPEVTIGDKSLREASRDEVAKAIMSVVSRCRSLREENKALHAEIDSLHSDLADVEKELDEAVKPGGTE